MITVMLVLAIGNLMLGCALAVVYDRFVQPRVQLATETAALPPRPVPSSSSAVFDRQLPSDPLEGVRERWNALIEAFSLQGLGQIETGLWVCLRQCEEARHQLTSADTLLRSANEQPFPLLEYESVVRACSHWRDDLQEAIRQISSSSEAAAGPQPLGGLLADYRSEIAAGLAVLEERENGLIRLSSPQRDTLGRLLDIAYRMRDELYECLAVELEARHRIADMAAHLRVDPEMAVYNRIGLEYLIGTCRGSDPENRGTISIALIDIDRFHRIQQELGAKKSDSFLAVFAEMAERALRHNRGFDRAARIGGHSFVFFLGSTPLEGSEIVCERLRQQVEAASFIIDGRELEVTVSCGAVELQPNESSVDVLKRLRAALSEARKAGRNRTCLDNCQQYTIIQPKQFQVTGQTIEVPLKREN